MSLRFILPLVVCFLVLPEPLFAEDWEKLTSYSPDKKFAMRIVCESAPDDPKQVESTSIKSLDLVSLPDKEIVAKLGAGEFGYLSDLVWSSDSNWCAFYYQSGSRVGDTNVYHLRDGKFVQLENDGLNVDVKGDTRNQYVEPVGWSKPGTLVLKQHTIFRGDAGDSTIQFTVRFDDKGKFRVISKKNIR